MQVADIDVYDSIISQLRSFIAEVQGDCGMISQAATDLRDNTENDAKVENITSDVFTSVQVINGSLSQVEDLIRSLQTERDMILEAGGR